MRKIATLLALVIASITAIIPDVSAAGPTRELTAEQKQTALAAMREELPQKVEEGMTWTAVDLVENGKVLSITIAMDPEQLGVSTAEFKESLGTLSESEKREQFWNDDFEYLCQMFGARNLQIVFSFPDGSRQVMHIPATAK